MIRVIGTTAPLAMGVMAAVALVLSGVDAHANQFDNSTIDDVNFGPAQATGGTNLDFNNAEFKIGITNYGGYFGTSISDDLDITEAYYYTGYGRWVYSFRSVNGSFSNSNEAGTKRVFIEWMMTEPDTTNRGLRGALLHQKHDVVVRVTLYTTGGTTTDSDEVDACSVRANARSPRSSETPTAVHINLVCRRGALADIGFSDNQIDCIEEALETRSRSFRYVWRQ